MGKMGKISKSHAPSNFPLGPALLPAGRFRLFDLDLSVSAEFTGVKRPGSLNWRTFPPVELSSTIATFDNSPAGNAFRTPLILRQLTICSGLAFHLRMKECRPRSVKAVSAQSQTGPQIQSGRKGS